MLLKCKNKTIKSCNIVLEHRHKDPPMAEMQLSKLTALMSVFAVCTVQKKHDSVSWRESNKPWLVAIFCQQHGVLALWPFPLGTSLSGVICCRLRSDVSHKPCHLILM